jgi:hypothetical protein
MTDLKALAYDSFTKHRKRSRLTATSIRRPS